MDDKKEQGEIKEAGLKVTVPRTKILQLLGQAPGTHFSAEDIYKQLIDQGQDIGLATVYRVLTQFEAAGIVMRHHFGDNQSVFELDTGEHHDHLICVRCNKVEEFIDEAIEVRQAAIAKKYGYKITDHKLNVYGICKQCQSQLKA